MPGHGQEASQLKRTQVPYNCQVNSRFLAVHCPPRHIVDNLASFLRGRHPKTVIFRYYSQEQEKRTGQSCRHVDEETNILECISLLFLHDAMASWEALGYNLSSLAHDQTGLPNTKALSSPDSEVIVWRVDVKLLS